MPVPVPAPLPYPRSSPVKSILSFAYGRWSKTIPEMRRTSLRKQYRPTRSTPFFTRGKWFGPRFVAWVIQSQKSQFHFWSRPPSTRARKQLSRSSALQLERPLLKLHATIVAAAVADVPDPYEYVIIVHRREGSSETPPVLEKRNAFTVSKVFATDGKSAAPDS